MATPHSVLSLYILGRKCTIISDPKLARTAFEDHAAALDTHSLQNQLLVNVYGADSKASVAKSANAIPNLATTVPACIAALKAALESNLPDLISFSESPVDQAPWERLASAHLTQQTYGMKLRPAVSVNLIPLLTNFAGHTCLTALLGRDFIEAYPSILEDLSDMDSAWKYLALGFPRWVPFPRITKAHFARRRLLDAIRSFHGALDAEDGNEQPEYPWRDLSDVSIFMRDRRSEWRARKLSSRASAAADLALIWR